MNISQLISNLVFYARARLDLPQSDIIYVTNRLLEALGETAYTQCPNEDFVSNIASPDRVVAPLAQYAKEKGIISSVEEDAFACKLLDIVSLRPSQIIDKFYALHAFDKKSAFDYLYNYGVYSDYIKSTAIAKNIMWSADKTKGKLVITINLSKPEKSNKDTAKLLSNTTATYPKCAICPENIGYCGRGVVRQTLRAIPIILGREKWVWQFSPYAYFYQHGIAINCKHTPMKVDGNTIVKLLDFVEYAPQYFIGCNAALPIVGGSILTHDHFQGGAQLLPMHSASVLKWYTCIESKVNIGILDWYNSVIYLESADRKAVQTLATTIIDSWKNYSDESVGILAKTTDVHNTLTPIVRKVDGVYRVYLILRNNRCDEAHPDGIFHAHKEYHNIKSEAIGLIEAMGMFILPARLSRQLTEVSSALCGKVNVDNLSEDMEIHRDMIMRLVNQYGVDNDEDKAKLIVKEEVERVCENILDNTSVFKKNSQGADAFNKFILSCNITK